MKDRQGCSTSADRTLYVKHLSSLLRLTDHGRSASALRLVGSRNAARLIAHTQAGGLEKVLVCCLVVLSIFLVGANAEGAKEGDDSGVHCT